MYLTAKKRVKNVLSEILNSQVDNMEGLPNTPNCMESKIIMFELYHKT